MSSSGPIALWSTAAGADALQSTYESPGFATFAHTKPPTSASAAIASYAENSVSPSDVVVIDELPVTFPFIQKLGASEYLIVGSRCAWSPEGPEKNAVVVDSTGAIVRVGTFGDGIEHVQVDSNGDIWVGYFDEGVYGNFGWGTPGPSPIGSPGIVRWSSEFEQLWDYPWEDAAVIDDCYTMNVVDDVVWACTASDFPILRIAESRVQMQTTTKVSGPKGLVIAGDRVGLIGSYDDPSMLLTSRFATGEQATVQKASLTLPNGAPLSRARLECRGATANLFDGPSWYTFTLPAG